MHAMAPAAMGQSSRVAVAARAIPTATANRDRHTIARPTVTSGLLNMSRSPLWVVRGHHGCGPAPGRIRTGVHQRRHRARPTGPAAGPAWTTGPWPAPDAAGPAG